MKPHQVDVLIVGAGPAGSTLASILAARGVDTLTVDRATFPRAKPCGECLNPGSVRMLGKLGVLDRLSRYAPAPIHGWTLSMPGDVSAVGGYDRGDVGFGMPRIDFDNALVEWARDRGSQIVENTRVIGVDALPSGGYAVRCRSAGVSEHTVRCRYLVGADGLRSLVARRLGLIRYRARLRKLSITCRLEWSGAKSDRGMLQVSDDCTVGLAPVHASGSHWNGTVVMPSLHWNCRGPELIQVYRDKLSTAISSGGNRPVIIDGPWTSGPFDWSVPRPAGRDALLVGDAAGYFDPLTGQGIYQSLRTAELAAEVLLEILTDSADSRGLLERYARRVVRERLATRLFQRTVDGVLRRRAIRRFAIRRLRRAPRYADQLIRFAGDVLPASGLGRLDLLAAVEPTP